MVSKKGKRKKKKEGKSNKSSSVPGTAGIIFAEGSREANEARWDDISSQLSRILRGEVTIQCRFIFSPEKALYYLELDKIKIVQKLNERTRRWEPTSILQH